MFVFIYHSSSHTADNKGRKAANRMERVRKRRKEEKVAEKKRETELKETDKREQTVKAKTEGSKRNVKRNKEW